MEPRLLVRHLQIELALCAIDPSVLRGARTRQEHRKRDHAVWGQKPRRRDVR